MPVDDMPDISATIRGLLAADSTVTDVVSTRIRSDILKQGETLPAITYQVVDTLPTETLTAIANIARARIQINCFAATRAAANSLADKVRIALEKKHRGDNSGQFINEISLATGEVHLIERPESGTDQRRFITALDFFVHYRTTTS